MGMWRTGIIAVGVFAALAAGMGGAVAARKEAAPARIIIADAKTTNHLNLYVAQERGLFQKHGLDVAIVEARDPALARDLVISGQADVFWSCPSVAVSAIANGAPLKIIAQVKAPCSSLLVVPKGSPIRSYRDLNGKRIAGSAPACEAVIAYEKKAREAGARFVLEKLAGGPAIVALDAGKVDGAILEDPHLAIAEIKGYRAILRDAPQKFPCRTINARTAYLKENPDALKRLVAAIREANTLINKAPASRQIAEIAQKYTGAPQQAITRAARRFTFNDRIDEKGLHVLGEDLAAIKEIRENPKENLYAAAFKGITWGAAR
ncbi:ABC transporter substrate-binding protein [Oryzomonas sagensis]|uniref:ABC transporter substrate-binding protein n=1 Tax=Oryzomonas sagensis TaxID=2603857 RepID=A0ABQ6TKY7_9BACT|nr:ABC transporter substrate-binding protein [Oryzomonas sagensis]KAB0668731.1 ABC transporter substrate-binding protein [Oryzomonas sagensis]